MKKNIKKIHFQLFMKDSLIIFQEPHGSNKTPEKTENHSTRQNAKDDPLGQK
jgi:hypothetical protein